MSVELKGQKQVFWTIIFSVGFFVYGVSTSSSDLSQSKILAKADVPPAANRGIASE